MPHLLLFTPTYGDAMRPETVAAVRALRWAGELQWEVGRDDPFPVGDLRNVVVKYRRARELALAGGYDGLVTIEHDMGPPADALELLWNAPGDVVYGVYLLRHGLRVVNALRYDNERNVGQSLSLYGRELQQARRAGVVRVSGVGWGCTLIRRSVLERIPFRLTDEHDAGDMAFATDCLRSGVKMAAHFGVPCLHYDSGEILSPERESEMAVVVAAANVTVAVSGASVKLIAGQRYEMPLPDALEQQRAGYVRVAIPALPAAVQKATDDPLIEVLTRTNRRPTLLALNRASLAEQTSGDWVQTLLQDGESRGIGWSYANMAAYAPKLVGRYIWILDDDDVCVHPTLFAEVADLVAEHDPDVIMVQMDHGGALGVLPDKSWRRPPMLGNIGVSAYIVRREIWQAHAHA
ncbi:MAG: hypothetical protein KAX65_00520, partial [Caldilineaceae bacterium]|nr:hypothetical protein [Caldilineaceae bacterium]